MGVTYSAEVKKKPINERQQMANEVLSVGGISQVKVMARVEAYDPNAQDKPKVDKTEVNKMKKIFGF